MVRGDLVLLAEGDRVPGNAALVSANNLQVDESLLTGEAVLVNKKTSVMIGLVTVALKSQQKYFLQ